MSDQYTPTGGQTIFPRINFLKTFSSRLQQRISNGRVAMYFKRLFGDASLDLNFASSKSLVDSVSGNNLVTFSRASSGTYVGSDGLIKNSVVNLLTYSEQFDNAAWAVQGTPTLVASSQVAPNGSSDAWDFTRPDGGGNHIYQQKTGLSTSTTYTYSLYVKVATGTADFQLLVYDDATRESGVFTATTEWQRFDFTFQPSSAATVNFYLANPEPSAYGTALTVWGAQVEEGLTASDYIPTTSTISGAPRFDHDPVTGESLGLLIEEERTNLITYSEEFDQSAWDKLNLTVTPNNTVAPDGTATAELVLDNTVSTSHQVYQTTPTLNSSTAYTFSVYAKAASLNYCFLLFYSGGGAIGNSIASFDLVNNTSSNVVGSPVTSIKDVGDGWKRISITATTSSAATTLAEVRLSEDGDWNNRNYAGTGQGIYIWGAQLEAASFPSSYIPTTDSAVTRSPDIATIEGTNFSSWYNQSEGTFYGQATKLGTNNSPRLFITSTGSTRTSDVYRDAASTQLALRSSSTVFELYDDYTEPFTLTAAYKANDFAGSLNGVLAFTGVSGSVLTCDRLTLGNYYSGSFYANGHISRLSYFPTRKSDEDLINLTT